MPEAKYDEIAHRLPGYKEVPAILIIKCRKL
jgi:hypothetical protein